ncbi:MAG: hypothetical protein ACI9BF_000686 [Candidatus Paceibacteria bacterium]|jgi:hypothetical protein
MSEKMPTKSESPVETGYKREDVYEQAANELQQMLKEVVVPEQVPEKFHEVAALDLLRMRLDSTETDNSYRHVAWLLNDEFKTKLGVISHQDFILYQSTYRPQVLS